MLLVEIEKPEREPLSAWFSELRDWLDANHCASSTFTRTGRRVDRLIYRISFEEAVLAHQFLLKFSRYSPTIRRATPFERDQLRAMAAAGDAPSNNVPVGAAD
jgi:transposase